MQVSLCMNATPFPANLIVSYKNNHSGSSDRPVTQSSHVTKGQWHLPPQVESPWPDLWIRGNILVLGMTAIFRWWPILDLVR